MAAATAGHIGTWFGGQLRRVIAPGQALADNPVLVRGIRTRMRGGKAYGLLAFYVMALGIVMLLVYLSWAASYDYRYGGYQQYGGPGAGRELGRWLYLSIFITQGVLVFLIAPALSSGALTLELEQRTYEMLVCTRLTPRGIVIGKLLSGWLFLLMLITASLPMAGIAMLMGGISPGEIIIAYLAVVLAAFLFCAVGVFWSAVNTRSAAAGLASLASVIAFGIIAASMNVDGPEATPFSCLNPILATFFGTGDTSIFGLSLPNWLIGLPLLALGGALGALLAAAKVKGYRPHSQLVTRLLLLVVVWGGLLALYGAALSPSTGGYSVWVGSGLSRGSMAWLSGVTLGLLVLLTISLSSGDGRWLAMNGLIRRLAAGLHPRHMFSGSFQGGIGFALLLGLGTFALLGGSGVIASPHHQLFSAGMRLWAQAAAMSMAVLFGYASLAFLLSVVASRLAAAVLTTLAMIAVWVAPSAYTSFAWELGGRHLIVNEIIYLSPPVSLVALVGGERLPVTYAALSHLPLWVMTAIIHLVTGAVLLLIAQSVCRRRLRRQSVLAAREEAARAA